jgi:hypothetical protein
MPPNFLLPESTVKRDGVGPKIDLGRARGKLLVLTLGITSIVEQESLEVSTWGSEDGDIWGTRPLATFLLWPLFDSAEPRSPSRNRVPNGGSGK